MGSLHSKLKQLKLYRQVQRYLEWRRRLICYVYQHPLEALNRKQRRSAWHSNRKLARQLPATMKPARRRVDEHGNVLYVPAR